MEKIEEYLFNEMVKAMEKKNVLELQLIIAEEELQRIRAAYKAYKGEN